MNYIRQLIYDMRHHKMMTWVSISGTALSIFLVLVYFMVRSIPTVEVAPESNRHRIYGETWMQMDITEGDRKGWNASYAFTYNTAKKLFGDLEGVELVSYKTYMNDAFNVQIPGKAPVTGYGQFVDGNFWKIYDFRFIDGRPFTDDECLNTTNRVMVISDKIARKLFGTSEAVGNEVNVNGGKYNIVGVVENTNPILKNSWGEIYLPLENSIRGSAWNEAWYEPMGKLGAYMLYAEGTDPEAVTKQIMSRFARFNAEIEKTGVKATIREPDTPKQMGSKSKGNSASHVSKIANREWLVYVLLLLLPAINLSSMMRGRMQHRISEIGVRRAYGAKRWDIVAQLLGENLAVTLVGGIIGLVLSYIFMMLFSSSFVTMLDHWSISSYDIMTATPTFKMLFTWQAFAMALGACLVLNILTASVPAWKASSIEPAVAISKSKI